MRFHVILRARRPYDACVDAPRRNATVPANCASARTYFTTTMSGRPAVASRTAFELLQVERGSESSEEEEIVEEEPAQPELYVCGCLWMAAGVANSRL